MGIAGGGMAAAMLGGALHAQEQAEGKKKREYKISLAGWSLHRTIGEKEGQTPMLEMPRLAREEFGIEAIELVNGMLASDEPAYLKKLAAEADKHDVKILLIMVDGQGAVGARSERVRERAVERHNHWVDIAAEYGCHSIRMNWAGAPRDVMEKPEELDAFIERSIPPFQKICEYGDKKNINVLIENHWGPSSYIEPMRRLMEGVGHPRFGTLPDFGNFPDEVDKYEAVDAMMKYAKAVSAKCYDFDPGTGEETTIDYERMMQICVDKHGYHGYIGIEFEGGKMSEFEGIKACKALLEKLRG